MSEISEQLAFAATLTFLQNMRDLGWPSLPGLLGSMFLVDGKPIDQVLEQDWADAVKATVGADMSTKEGTLTMSAAYRVAFEFLDRQFQRGCEDIDAVIDALGPDASPEQAAQIESDWAEAMMTAK
jgi:hypothetical protein